jgi:hypothetical protein
MEDNDKPMYLQSMMYPDDSEFQRSDQISVSADVWECFHSGWESERPLFVRIGIDSDASVVCRLRPDTETPLDMCQIPEWLWLQMGAPSPDDWISIRIVKIPVAKRLVLRSYIEKTLTDMEDPVATLTLALSGAEGHGWSCLNRGADLPLACGNFSIVDILDEEDISIPAACILDIDLELDIVPAVNAVSPIVRPPTPIPEDIPVVDHVPIMTQTPPQHAHRNGFIPFSGVGRRLCD